MKTRFRYLWLAGCVAALLSTSAWAQPAAFTMQVVEIDGVPITPSTNVAVAPGQTFMVEYGIEGWASPTSDSCTIDSDCPQGEECTLNTCERLLYGFQVGLEPTSLTSNGGSVLELATVACTNDDQCFNGAWISDCLDGYCEGNGLRCDTAAPLCLDGSDCIPDPDGDFCDCFASLYSDKDRIDFVFYLRGIISLPDCTSEEAQAGGYKIGGSLLSLDGERDTGVVDYAATMVFMVPDSGYGLFTLAFDLVPDTTVGRVANGYPLLPLDLSSTVTIDAGPCVVALAGGPLDCEVDARQPHDLNDANIKFGWDSIELEFTGDPSGLATMDFDIEQLPDGFPPSITGFMPAGGGSNTGTLSLFPSINPGKWTCVYLRSDENNKVCVGYLPGDADRDGTTAPADILAVIDDLNDVIPGDIWEIDMDRDGTKAPADILRVIDLLNGAGQLQSWNGVSLEPWPCPSE